MTDAMPLAVTPAVVIPVIAFGRDRRWAAHLQRLLSPHPAFAWKGLVAGDVLPPGHDAAASAWLVDGDDPRSERLPVQEGSARLCFFRQPDVPRLRLCAAQGASACLDKQLSATELVGAIEAAMSGLFTAQRALLARALASERRSPAPLEGLSHLTDRQREIVHWASMGLSNKQIGRRLGISPETVKSHLHQIFAREGISGRVALLALHQSERRTPEDQPSA